MLKRGHHLFHFACLSPVLWASAIAPVILLSTLAIWASSRFSPTAALVENPKEWSLIWSEEFNGPRLESNNWSFDIGGNGWGNNELQTYTSRETNAYLHQGSLVIKALKETHTGPDKSN